MPEPHVTDSFLDLLQQSELLSGEQIAAAVDEYGLAELPSALEVARALVAHGVLTRFQAERLLRGRCRGFFIDRYKVLGLLGAGGMGWIYTAEEAGTGRRIALKVLSENYRDDAGMQARLQLEAKAGAMLDHPNIIRTERVGSTGAVDYVVMELVEGISLRELLSLQGPPGWRQACDFIRQAAAGLHHAHRRGLVHRDVKPANLLVDHSGTVKIHDFGLALVKAKGEDEFSLAMIFGHDCLGTADYIAPEQSLDSLSADARADIYSLGCTLYHILAGVVPFPYDSPRQKVVAQRNEQPRPLRELAPDVPPELAAIVARMMAKRPEERFQTAPEVCRALEPFAQRQPVEFDFEAVLAARGRDARQRQKAIEKSRPQPDNSSLMAARGFESSLTGGISHAGIETAVRSAGDTQPVERGRRRRKHRPSAGSPAVEPESAPQPTEDAPQAPPPEKRSYATSQSPPGRRALATLVPIGGGEPIFLSKKSIVIGRDAGCDVQIADSSVSNRHCELHFEGDGWRVVDLGSKNGVQVEGVETKEHTLLPGHRLTIARQHHFQLVDGTARPRRRWSWAWVIGGLVAVSALGALLALVLFGR